MKNTIEFKNGSTIEYDDSEDCTIIRGSNSNTNTDSIPSDDTRRCDCGAEVEYDGYNNIRIEEDLFRIEGDAVCPGCKKKYSYIEYYRCDFNNPADVVLEEYDE